MINVNTARVLNRRKIATSTPVDPLKEAYSKYASSMVLTDGLEYIDKLKYEPNYKIYENIVTLFNIPVYGPKFVREFAYSSMMKSKLISETRDVLNSIIEKTESIDNILQDDIVDHIEDLKRTLGFLDVLNDTRSSNDYVKASIKLTIESCRIVKEANLYLAQDLEVVSNTINYSPEVLTIYQKIIKEIRLAKPEKLINDVPTLINKNSEILMGIKITLGEGTKIVNDLPVAIVDTLLSGRILNQKKTQNIIKVLDFNIKLLYKNMIHDESKKHNLYISYIDTLKHQIERLEDYMDSSDIITESMCDDDTDFYEERVLDDFTGDLEDFVLDNMFSDEDEITEESLAKFTKAYLTLEGKLGDAAKNTAHKMHDGAQKTMSKIATATSNTKRIVEPIKKIADPVVNLINKTVNSIKDMDAKERRERIATGDFKFKLFNTLRKGIGIIVGAKVGIAAASGSIAGMALGPVIALIAILSSCALDAKLDRKMRQQILNELEAELKIVNEKVDDSKSDDSKEKKYQLMRLQSKLENDIDRIKYRLDERV